jgi:hypothetical protein
MICAATNAAEVNHNGNNQNQQINASYRLRIEIVHVFRPCSQLNLGGVQRKT